jgi:hypothetical protein
MKKYLLLFGWLIAIPGFAQTYPKKDIDIDAFIQELFNTQDEDVNYDDLYESLYQLYTNPLDMNTATRDELQNLYVLSQPQIGNFLKYREQNGKFLSIYELQAVPGFNLTVIYKLLPFIEIENSVNDNRPLLQRIADEPNNYLLLRYDRVLQSSKGYSPAVPNSSGDLPQRYLGSPDKLYLRYRVSHTKDFSFGFTAEKDAGEQLAWEPQTRRYGADFVSLHAQLMNRGRIKNIVLGDYQVQFGQGLIVSAGFAVGKGAETINTVRRSNLGIRPYSSVLESGFFRGGGATYQINDRLELTGFYSRLRRDAAILNSNDTTETIEDYVSSVRITGFHRTASEIAAKGDILEQNGGGNLLYRSKDKNFEAGITGFYTEYGNALKRTPTDYNQFEFSGKRNLVLGGNFTYNFQNFNFFGEAARSSSGGLGVLAGFVSSLSAKVEMSMLYRNYAKNFQSFYANSFGENSRNINEQGVYWGLKYTPFRKLIFAAYFDKFSFPWLKFQTTAPSDGYEYLVRVTYKPTKTILTYAQYVEENKERDFPNNLTRINYPDPVTRRKYLLNADYNASKFVFLRSRVQMSQYDRAGNTTFGYALIQDVNFEYQQFELSTRFALFDTDNYDNRIYSYEKDVLYAFSIPAYFDRGIRTYFLLRYKASRKLDFWLRYSQTSLRDQKTSGSGLDEIPGRIKSEFKAQMRILF